MSDKLIWIDLEMTGLNPEKGAIIEIATIVTDDKLELVAEGPNMAINHPEEVLNTMDEWNMTTHKESGLLDRVKVSPYDYQGAEKMTLEFMSIHCKKEESPLCGNSVWQDRRFLIKHMPRLEDFLHYRNIDVSSIKELVKRWYPSLPPYKKENSHLALSDIKESINELKYYRQKVFLPGNKVF
ncbi:MAG: oligoribonuclease [Desulfobacteraceae bacterium]|nr:oligoribonuclease [Desulfobacteraceae bacterium]